MTFPQPPHLCKLGSPENDEAPEGRGALYAHRVGILEWLGPHLLAPLVNLYRATQARPRPDLRILELTATGGGSNVDFSAYVQNYGTQPTRDCDGSH